MRTSSRVSYRRASGWTEGRVIHRDGRGGGGGRRDFAAVRAGEGGPPGRSRGSPLAWRVPDRRGAWRIECVWIDALARLRRRVDFPQPAWWRGWGGGGGGHGWR